jgi:hypothetical protein
MSQTKKYRDEKTITDNEVLRLKTEVYELQQKVKRMEAEATEEITATVEVFNDPFLKLLLANTPGQPTLIVGEVMRGLCMVKQKEGEELEGLRKKAGLDYRPVSANAMVKELIRQIEVGRGDLDRERASWKAQEQALQGKIGRLEAQIKESAKHSEVLMHMDMETIRKEA